MNSCVSQQSGPWWCARGGRVLIGHVNGDCFVAFLFRPTLIHTCVICFCVCGTWTRDQLLHPITSCFFFNVVLATFEIFARSSFLFVFSSETHDLEQDCLPLACKTSRNLFLTNCYIPKTTKWMFAERNGTNDNGLADPSASVKPHARDNMPWRMWRTWFEQQT